MTTPRWIAEALDSLHHPHDMLPDGIDAAATALIERLPIEAMGRAAENSATGDGATDRALARDAVTRIVGVLTDGDSEVVQLAELYQGACRALDAAGVPYAVDIEPVGDEVASAPGIILREARAPRSQMLDLAGRIRWLAQQRPTRLELQRVETERDHARGEHAEASAAFAESIADASIERDKLAAERDQLQRMYEGASDDLNRERSAHQEAEAAASNREISLTVDLETARQEAQSRSVAVTERDSRIAELENAIRDLAEGDLPSGDLRSALWDLLGGRVIAATDRQVLRAKVADQAAYIEQLECEIDALEEEIWEDEP